MQKAYQLLRQCPLDQLFVAARALSFVPWGNFASLFRRGTVDGSAFGDSLLRVWIGVNLFRRVYLCRRIDRHLVYRPGRENRSGCYQPSRDRRRGFDIADRSLRYSRSKRSYPLAVFISSLRAFAAFAENGYIL